MNPELKRKLTASFGASLGFRLLASEVTRWRLRGEELRRIIESGDLQEALLYLKEMNADGGELEGLARDYLMLGRLEVYSAFCRQLTISWNDRRIQEPLDYFEKLNLDGDPDGALVLLHAATAALGAQPGHESLPWCERALAATIACFGADDIQTASALENLSSAAKASGDLDRAVDCTKQALAIQRGQKKLEPRRIAATAHSLAVYLTELGRSDEAVPLAQEVIATLTAEKHPALGEAYETLAKAYSSAARYSEAIDVYHGSLATAAGNQDDSHCIRTVESLIALLDQTGVPSGTKAIADLKTS